MSLWFSLKFRKQSSITGHPTDGDFVSCEDYLQERIALRIEEGVEEMVDDMTSAGDSLSERDKEERVAQITELFTRKFAKLPKNATHTEVNSIVDAELDKLSEEALNYKGGGFWGWMEERARNRTASDPAKRANMTHDTMNKKNTLTKSWFLTDHDV